MKEELQEITQLSKLLALEKQADFEQHKALMENLSLSERKEKGFSWNPLVVIKTGYTIGDRAFVTVERTSDLNVSHKFRSGKTVNFYTTQSDAYKAQRTGVINFVDKNKMKIILNSNDLPDWLNGGQLGVDLMFDERTYLEMEKALKTLMETQQGRLVDLRAILLGKQVARFEKLTPLPPIPHLNESQNDAVNKILAANDVSIVHGPPGTGKTTTIVQAIKILCQKEHTVLVTAPSNAAVDLLTERLAQQDINVVRIGNISRMDESIVQHTLEGLMANHPESKNIKKVKIMAAESRRNARRYKRKFGHKEREERQQLRQEARELSQWANQLEDRLIDQILSGAQVITATLVGSANKVLKDRRFRTVVIDEAAQALEPATWIPIIKASKLVLCGDPFQLPPTVKSIDAAKKGLAITMIERCLQNFQDTSFLNIQYRMNQKIMNFSNRQFYNNQLQADESVKDWLLEIEDNKPVVFIDTVGCSFDEQQHPETLSRYNPDEFNMLREHLYLLLDAYKNQDHLPSLAIISPYREQVVYMKSEILADEKLVDIPLSIDTIDAFQGQERDIVYISLVRSNEKTEIGFLSDYRRMNVAMTRARKKLIVVGDSGTVGGHQFYEAFLNYCEEIDAYHSAWEYIQ